MGNVENKFETVEVLPLTDYIQVQKSTKDTRFGDFTLFSHKDDFSKQVALLSKVHSSDQAGDAEIQRTTELKQLTDTPNLINILFIEKKEKSEFCSNYWKIYAGLEYFPFSLADEIEVRRNRKEKFTENELSFIEMKFLRGVNDLEYNGINHLAVANKKLLIGPPSQAKLLYDLPFNSESYNALVADDKFYFSPAMFQSHVHGAIAQHDPSKSDVFSIGMCLLHAASMRSPSNLYDLDAANINENKLNLRFQSLKGKYSDKFIGELASMLNIHETHRPSASELSKSKNYSLIKPTDWLIYKEENPYSILKSRRGSRMSISQRDDRMSNIGDLNDFQSQPEIQKIPDPVQIADLKKPDSINRQSSQRQSLKKQSFSMIDAKQVDNYNHQNFESLQNIHPQVEERIKTETLTEPNLLYNQDVFEHTTPHKEGTVYATLLTNSKKLSAPKIEPTIGFFKPLGESKAQSDFGSGNQNLPVKQNITSKFELERYEKPYHYEKYLEKQVERPAVTYQTIANPVVYSYKELEYPAPQIYQYSEIREVEREPLPVLNTYERYTGVSSNVQGILEEIKGNKRIGADMNNTPNKYSLLKSAAQDAHYKMNSPGGTDDILNRYGLRKSFNGQSILMGDYKHGYNFR